MIWVVDDDDVVFYFALKFIDLHYDRTLRCYFIWLYKKKCCFRLSTAHFICDIESSFVYLYSTQICVCVCAILSFFDCKFLAYIFSPSFILQLGRLCCASKYSTFFSIFLSPSSSVLFWSSEKCFLFYLYVSLLFQLTPICVCVSFSRMLSGNCFFFVGVAVVFITLTGILYLKFKVCYSIKCMYYEMVVVLLPKNSNIAARIGKQQNMVEELWGVVLLWKYFCHFFAERTEKTIPLHWTTFIFSAISYTHFPLSKMWTSHLKWLVKYRKGKHNFPKKIDMMQCKYNNNNKKGDATSTLALPFLSSNTHYHLRRLLPSSTSKREIIHHSRK